MLNYLTSLWGKNTSETELSAEQQEIITLQERVAQLSAENKELKSRTRRNNRYCREIQHSFKIASSQVLDLRLDLLRIASNQQLDTDLSQKSVSKLFNVCQICFEAERALPVFIPCGHIGVCYDCLENIENICPFCTKPVDSVQDVYLTMDPDQVDEIASVSDNSCSGETSSTRTKKKRVKRKVKTHS